jgi:hypothetical protein
MRIWLAAAILLAVGTDPASACHRYSVWRYPHAQQCGIHPAPKRAAKLEIGAGAKIWRVEITKDPPARIEPAELADQPAEVGRLFEVGRLRAAEDMKLPGAD